MSHYVNGRFNEFRGWDPTVAPDAPWLARGYLLVSEVAERLLNTALMSESDIMTCRRLLTMRERVPHGYSIRSWCAFFDRKPTVSVSDPLLRALRDEAVLIGTGLALAQRQGG